MLALHWRRLCRDSRFLWREVDLKVGTRRRRNSKPRVGMGQLSDLVSQGDWDLPGSSTVVEVAVQPQIHMPQHAR